MCARHGRGATEICLSEKGALAKTRLGNTVLDQNISLKFSLETRLESESFEHLINFLAFLGSKVMI